ncbi:MAG: hypothetical protein U0798_05835 [Gemmataceae bacterium]
MLQWLVRTDGETVCGRWTGHQRTSKSIDCGVVFRLFTHEPSFIEYDEEGNGPPEAAGFSTIVDIGTPTARILLKAITVGFGLLILVTCRNRTDEPTSIRSGLRISAEWSLIFLGMLLLSERTWKHHAVTLILPFLVPRRRRSLPPPKPCGGRAESRSG